MPWLQIILFLAKAFFEFATNMGWLKKNDPTYTLEERQADAAEFSAAAVETKETNNVSRINRALERMRHRRAGRVLAMRDEKSGTVA